MVLDRRQSDEQERLRRRPYGARRDAGSGKDNSPVQSTLQRKALYDVRAAYYYSICLSFALDAPLPFSMYIWVKQGLRPRAGSVSFLFGLDVSLVLVWVVRYVCLTRSLSASSAF